MILQMGETENDNGILNTYIYLLLTGTRVQRMEKMIINKCMGGLAKI
jgi:hypothetical protein